MATLIWKDGKPYEVPDDRVNQALADGFTVPTQEQAIQVVAGDQAAEAALEGVARGLTFGLSDQGLAQGAMKQARREQNPGSALAGETAGVLGSALVGGPAAVTGKLSAGIAERLGSGVLGAGVGAAAEGSLYGLGQAISESGLSDTELTGEKLAAHSLGGALLGGSLGVGFKGLSKGAGAVMNTLGEGSVRAAVRGASNKVLKMRLGSMAQLRKMDTHANWDDIVDFGVKEGIINKGTTYESGFEAAQAALDRRKPQYDALLDKLQEIAPAGAREKVMAPVAGVEMTAANLPPVTIGIMEKVSKALAPFKKDAFTRETADALESRLQANLSRRDLTWRELKEQVERVRGMLPATGASTGATQVAEAAHNSLRDAINSEAERLLKYVKGPELKTLQQLNRDYYHASRLKDLFSDKLFGSELNNAADFITPGAVGFWVGGPAGAAAAVGSRAARNVVRERGGFLAAGVLRDLADGEFLPGIAETFRKQVLGRLAMGPAGLGPFGPVLQMAAAKGGAELLDTHLQLAQSAQGPAYMQAMGMTPETPEEALQYEQKLAHLESIKRAASKYDRQLDDGVKSFLSGDGYAAREPAPVDYEKAAKTVRQLAYDPSTALQEIDQNVMGAAPATVQAAVGSALRSAEFLASKLPKSPYEGMPPALAPSWSPSEADKARFMKYFRAASEGPGGLLEDMKRGVLSPEQREVAEQIYPRLFEDMRLRLVQQIGTVKDRLPYERRLVLSRLLGPEVLGLSQQQLAMLQAAHAKTGANMAQPSRPDGRQSTDVEKNMETQAQRIQGR